MLEKDSLTLLREVLDTLDAGFANLPTLTADLDHDRMRQVLMQTAERMQDNYPYHHPFYVGQMLKPPHPIARLAYALSLWINPNNHALDGGRASSAMEKEAVAKIASMFGWDTHLGHLTSGGTMANLEALWIAGKLHPTKKVVASAQAHYTHSRITEVLHIPFQSVPVDQYARMDVQALRKLLETGEVGTVVVTLGTTAVGAVDPLPEILALRDEYAFRIHIDSAYGGYFVLADNLSDSAHAAYEMISLVDSIVIDPHKHGLQPYGCGCVLFKDPSVGRFYKHDSPYTYFSSEDLHLGEISLECSRAGASAVALWTTMALMPLVPQGEFAQSLSQCRRAAMALFDRLQGDARFKVAFAPELDIVIWAVRAESASQASELAQRIFDRAAEHDLHMALTRLPRTLLEPWFGDLDWDQETVTCLRTCLMKPEHLTWLDAIWDVLSQATDEVLGGT